MSYSPSPRKDRSSAGVPISPEKAGEHIRILEAALDSLEDGVLVADESGRILAANAAALDLLGPANAVVLPSDWMKGDSPVTLALRGESVGRAEFVLPGSGGRRVHVSTRPLPQPSGGWAAVIALRPIAEAGAALQEEQNWSWDILETVASLMVVLDRNGHIVRFNSACQLATGYAPEEVAGACLWDLLPSPEDAETVRRWFGEFRAARFPSHYECQWIAKDGARRLIAWSNTALTGRDGEVDYVVGTGTDIGERKRNEDALRQANHTLRAVIETSPLAIVSMDLQGNVRSWNRAAERIFGWREEEVLDRLFPIVPEDDMEFFRGNLERIQRGETLAGVERQRRRKDGSLVEVELWNAPLRDASGRTVGAISVIADATQRKRLEQFRQSQKMEAVGRLAGGVAHDFNNLLTVITGYSHMVLDALVADDPLRGHVEEVLRGAESAAALTGQLLAFSRRQIVQPRVMDLNTLVGSMDKMLHRLIGEDIELVTVLSPQLPKVKVDAGQLQQVLMNLVVNSRDAMPEGGRLTIETTSMVLEGGRTFGSPALAPGTYVSLAVTDTGKGMDEETRRRVFEPFFTTKGRGKGTGLGLSTAYGIIQQSGGDISVSTEAGKGSQFRIYLPAVEEAAVAAVQAGPLPSRQGGTETVLLVEDEPGLRKLVREVLSAHGYVVLQAGDMREALRVCEQHLGPIHLFLTDIVMPRMSGRELAQRALALRPCMKVLFMSGYTGSTPLPTPFLQKPFPPDTLLSKVRQVLDAT